MPFRTRPARFAATLLRLAFRLVLLGSLAVPAARAAAPVSICPERAAGFSQTLNGAWSFKYIPSLDAGPDEKFPAPAFDVAAWKTITVPGHWELQGFAEPQYADDVKEGLGLYRRTFRVDSAWAGRRVFLRFDGVLYGFAAFVNGKPVGEWAGGFLQSTFDITDALALGGGDNVLAVRVTTRPKGWDFDTMDCWAISGIYRDVTLFALPEAHIKDYTARTTLQPDGSARLDLDVTASAPGSVSGRLLSPDGRPVKTFDLALSADGRGSAGLVVDRPLLWNAESPSLYRLELALKSADGKTAQEFSARVGLRQVTIEDGVLKLNGSPIKLRGVDHHEIWPEGRVSTDENTRRDLVLIRDANINFIRTSHYPPHPRLLDLCDELGLYVLDEVPYIHGRKNLKNPDYQETLYARARATLARDQNHACVLFWSLGNENPITTLGNNTAAYVKSLDPTRPVLFPTIGSYFAENYQKLPATTEIYAPHYPSAKKVKEFAETLTRPIIFTEYAHQRGLNRGGTNVQTLWELFYHSPRIAGGAVWMFQDQGLLRTTDDPASVKDGDLMAWIDDHNYYDTHGFFAMDGIVYADRTPQVDYWMIRKVYSPVQIKQSELPARPGAQSRSVEIENRHDFRTLAGITLRWALLQNGAALQHGECPLGAKPRQTETVALPVTLPADLGSGVFTLDLRCADETGRQFYEHTLRLDTGAAKDARWSALLASLSPSPPTLELTDSTAIVRTTNIRLELDRVTGRLVLRSADGAVLVSAFGPHTGRHPTINDMGKDRERLPELWAGRLLSDVADLKTDARQTPAGIQLSVSGRYPRPGKPEESVTGGCKLLVTPQGAIEVSYDYAPLNATGDMLEAGFALAVPAAQSEFRWLGQGPYAGYPGKDRQNDYGLFHLNREDLYFPGNRRDVELASLASPAGPGFVLGGADMTIDLENQDGSTFVSHLALVPGARSNNDGKGENVDISSRLHTSQIKSISGRFELLPLTAAWPRPMMTWFGAPDARVEVKKPFLRSYDQ